MLDKPIVRQRGVYLYWYFLLPPPPNGQVSAKKSAERGCPLEKRNSLNKKGLPFEISKAFGSV